MHFLKRIELWILLAVVVAGLAWVFTSGGSEEEAGDGGPATVEDSRAPLQLHRCVLKRDYANARLDIELRVRNDGPDALAMQSPKVKLLSTRGNEVPSFFLPFDPIPQVPAQSTQDVQLRYWLETADLQGALTLHVGDRTLPVKGVAAFDLNTLKNGEEKVVREGEW